MQLRVHALQLQHSRLYGRRRNHSVGETKSKGDLRRRIRALPTTLAKTRSVAHDGGECSHGCVPRRLALTHGSVHIFFQINWILLISRQGKVRLAKWFTTLNPKTKSKIVKDVTQLVLARRTRMCNFLEYKDSKVVYRRYASLFFVTGISQGDNELVTLEIIHRYVEVLDRYFGNVRRTQRGSTDRLTWG